MLRELCWQLVVTGVPDAEQMWILSLEPSKTSTSGCLFHCALGTCRGIDGSVCAKTSPREVVPRLFE